MTLATSPSEATASGEKERPAARHGYRLGLLVALASVVVSVVLLPFALSSLYAAFKHPSGTRGFVITSTTPLHGEWTKLNIATVSIDETNQLITLRVTGFHNCPAGCHFIERAQLFSVHADPSGALGTPPSATVDFPARSGEVDQVVTLPISGDLIDYPFDHYRLLLGVTFSRVAHDGVVTTMPVTGQRPGLEYSLDNDIPRVSLGIPESLSPNRYNTIGAHYDSVTALNFYRPTYLKILTVLLTLLIILAAAYGVLFRPFTQIIPTVGGLVLGVWGVRSLLVGSYPPDSTGVDLVLEAAIFLLLLAIAVRAIFFMWPKTLLSRPHAAGLDGASPSEND